jgi:hypothetical protein
VTGHEAFLACHCPLTGRYLSPVKVATSLMSHMTQNVVYQQVNIIYFHTRLHIGLLEADPSRISQSSANASRGYL